MTSYDTAINNLRTSSQNLLRAQKINNTNVGDWESEYHLDQGRKIAQFSTKLAGMIFQADTLRKDLGAARATSKYMDYQHGITDPKTALVQKIQADKTKDTINAADSFSSDIAETSFQARKAGVNASFIEMYREADPSEKATLMKLWINDNLSEAKYKAYLSNEFLNNTDELTLLDNDGNPTPITWNINNAPNAQLKIASLGNLRESYLASLGLGNVDPEYIKQAGGYKLLTDTETKLAAEFTKSFDIKNSLDRQLVAKRNLHGELNKKSDDPTRDIKKAYWKLFDAYKGGVNEKGEAYDNYKKVWEAIDADLEILAKGGKIDLEKWDQIRTSIVPGSDNKNSPYYDKNFPNGYTAEQKWPIRFGESGELAQMITQKNVERGELKRRESKQKLEDAIDNIITTFEDPTNPPPTPNDLAAAEKELLKIADGRSIKRFTDWKGTFTIKPENLVAEDKFWREWVTVKKRRLSGREESMSAQFKSSEFYKNQIAKEKEIEERTNYSAELKALEVAYRRMLGDEYLKGGTDKRAFNGEQKDGWELLKAQFYEDVVHNNVLARQARINGENFIRENSGTWVEGANNGIFTTNLIGNDGEPVMPELSKAYEDRFSTPNEFGDVATYKAIKKKGGGTWEEQILTGKFPIPPKDYNASLANTGAIDSNVLSLSKASGLDPFTVMDLLLQSHKKGKLNPELIPEEANIMRTYLPKALQRIINTGDATPTQKKIANSIIYKQTKEGVLPFTMAQHELALALQEEAALEAETKEMNKNFKAESLLGLLRSISYDLDVSEEDVYYDFNIDGGLDILSEAIQENPGIVESLKTSEAGQWSASDFDWRATPTEGSTDYSSITGQPEALDEIYYMDYSLDNESDQEEKDPNLATQTVTISDQE
tara:strand:- start:430 stop:3090 length:2661 start_codon:yes stop_codon:yes gene_type:complete